MTEILLDGWPSDEQDVETRSPTRTTRGDVVEQQAASPSGRLAAHLDSEMQFKRSLHDARCCRADHLTKRRATDVAVNGVRAEKLRVVQRVEGLKAKFQRSRLRQLRSLQQGDVPVTHQDPIGRPTSHQLPILR